jgi:hypothetical protein
MFVARVMQVTGETDEGSSMVQMMAAVAGAIALVAVLYDVTRATLSARGTGPLFGAVSRIVGALTRGIDGGRVRSAAGPAVLIAGFLLWAGLFWIGWALIFAGDPLSVVTSENRVPADLLQRIYFVGISISTLGMGDVVANGWPWRLLSVIAALSGFFLLTLAVTFLMSLMPAVARKRSVASHIAALGGTPEALLSEPREMRRCDALLAHAPGLASDLSGLTQQYEAFPQLLHFCAPERRSSLAVQVAALNEALLVLESGAMPCEGPVHALRPLQNSIRMFADQLERLAVRPAAESPRAPDLELAGEPLARLQALLRRDDRERRLLKGLVEGSGWQWEDVCGDGGRSLRDGAGSVPLPVSH